MAKSGILALTLVLMAAAWTGISAQTSSSCTNVLISMSPCLNYITGNSSAPSSGCCSALGSVVKSQPQCLCQVISGSGSSSLGININRTQALQLPTACNVQTPSIARCSGAASPSGSSSTTGTPSSDNSGSSTTTPTTSTSTSTSTGSTESPSIDTSKGHAMKSGLSLFLALFFMATSARDSLSVIFI